MHDFISAPERAPSHWGKHLEFSQFWILRLFQFGYFVKIFGQKIWLSMENYGHSLKNEKKILDLD